MKTSTAAQAALVKIAAEEVKISKAAPMKFMDP